MNKVLPVVALLASCATIHLKSLEEEASDVCAKYSEEQLVEDAYKNMISSGIITAYDPIGDCFDYVADYGENVSYGSLNGHPMNYHFEARRANSDKCLTNTNSPALTGFFGSDVRSGLAISYKDPNNGREVLRLYTSPQKKPFLKRTYLSNNLNEAFWLTENRKWYDQVLLNALRLSCTLNKMRNP